MPPLAVKLIAPLALPKHNGLVITELNVGEFTTLTLMVVVVAHNPAVGVKRYVPDAVLLIVAGDHVPVIPLVDVVGNEGAALPEQIGPIALNVGTTGIFTVTVELAVAVHPHALVTVIV